MTDTFKAKLSEVLNEPIINISTVHGGDISEAFKLETPSNIYFLKCHNGADAFSMFETESKGLNLLSKTNSVRTPEVIAFDTFENLSFLLLEFVPSKSPNSKDYKVFGTQLANLHLNTTDAYGLDHDNKIGRLGQSNCQHKTWSAFYTYERLLPQLNLALQKGLLQDQDCPSVERMTTVLSGFFSDVTPGLLHGDLWSGNYLISETGIPYLIDPAVYYGDGLVDIAMSKLFGGFGPEFYDAYHDIIPKNKAYSERIDLYQLYYYWCI